MLEKVANGLVLLSLQLNVTVNLKTPDIKFSVCTFHTFLSMHLFVQLLLLAPKKVIRQFLFTNPMTQSCQKFKNCHIQHSLVYSAKYQEWGRGVKPHLTSSSCKKQILKNTLTFNTFLFYFLAKLKENMFYPIKNLLFIVFLLLASQII